MRCLKKRQNKETVVILKGRDGTTTVDTTGNVTGLDDVAAPMRNEIAYVLLSSRFATPPILKELGGEESALRGSNRDQPLKLIAPRRTVIVSTRPIFKWERLSQASAYAVYVNDASGQIIRRSDPLTSDRSEWLPPKALKRGEIYTWTVTAIVDGKEIIAPSPSAPQMKFQVLSASSFQQLNDLKRSRSHLALAVFYSKVGMIREAINHVQLLIRQNPDSRYARRLLKQVQSFQLTLHKKDSILPLD